MRKVMLLIAAAVTAVLFAGCASSQVAKPAQLNGATLNNETTVAHINAENWGLYFFMIPLITGSTENPGEMVFFEDTVRTENVVKMVTKMSKEMGATQTLNLISRHNSFVWWFGIRDVQVSANAVR